MHLNQLLVISCVATTLFQGSLFCGGDNENMVIIDDAPVRIPAQKRYRCDMSNIQPVASDHEWMLTGTVTPKSQPRHRPAAQQHTSITELLLKDEIRTVGAQTIK